MRITTSLTHSPMQSGVGEIMGGVEGLLLFISYIVLAIALLLVALEVFTD